MYFNSKFYRLRVTPGVAEGQKSTDFARRYEILTIGEISITLLKFITFQIRI